MANLITVKATATDGKVILWETHPLHVSKENKTGEVWIAANGRTSKVAKTPNVQRRLTSGALVEVNESKPAAQPVKVLTSPSTKTE